MKNKKLMAQILAGVLAGLMIFSAVIISVMYIVSA